MKWIFEERFSGTKVELGDQERVSDLVVESGPRHVVVGKTRCQSAFVARRKNFIQVWLNGKLFEFSATSPEQQIRKLLTGGHSVGGGETLVSKMPGKVLKVMVKSGDVIKPNQTLLVLEAMKMENHLHVSEDRIVDQVKVKSNDIVESGQTLITFKKS